jgi:hypothetical protein
MFYGTGLGAPLVGSVCEVTARYCAIADRAGRVAIVERATGAVMATQAFGPLEAMQFDEAGARLGVGAHRSAFEWSWRTGEVVDVGAPSSRQAVTVSARYLAWVEGSSGFTSEVMVTSRFGPASSHAFKSKYVKALHLLDEDLLLVVHTDSLEVWQLRGEAPPTPVASLELPAEPEPRLRPYGGRPVVEVCRSYLLVEASPTQWLVLTRRLVPVRTIALNREQVVVDPDSDRFAHLEARPSELTTAIVEDVASGRVLARADVKFSTGNRVRFSAAGLLFDSRLGRSGWDLQSPPRDVPGQGSAELLALVAGQRVEAVGSTVQFSDFFSPQPSAQAPSHGSSFVDGRVRLFGDHALFDSRKSEWSFEPRRVESWSALGVTLGEPLPGEPWTQEADTLTFTGGRTLRFSPGELGSVPWASVDAKQSRAVVCLPREWRLYDLTTGHVLRRVKEALEYATASFADDGSFLVTDAQWLTLYDRQGLVRGRLHHFTPDPNGFRSSDGLRPRVLWAGRSVVVALNQQLWFLKAQDLSVEGQVSADVVGLARTTTGVAVSLRQGLALYEETGGLRQQIEAARNVTGVQVVSEEGERVAFCDGARLVVLNQRGELEDEDASLCERATAIGVSRTHLAAVRDGAVLFVRRDDRSRWQLRSFAQPQGRGLRSGPHGAQPEAPERALLVRHGDQFEVWPSAARPFSSSVGAGLESASGLLDALWRPEAAPPDGR